MNVVYETSTLSDLTKHGETKFWVGLILQNGKQFFHSSRTWRTTKDGGTSKVVESEPYEVYAKNMGKKNETTPEEQARLEMNSIEQKKIDKGYAKPGTKSKVLPQPMLAHKFKEYEDKIDFPAFIQPKLDGNRRLYDGTKSWSRGGKLFLDEVVKHLDFDTEGHIIDGEIMLPVGALVQDSNSAIKKARKESGQLCYYVYDIMDDTIPFLERNILLSRLMKKNTNPNIIYVPTIKVSDTSEIWEQHNKWVKEGFEGTMIRNLSGMYDFGHRSYDLQKLKDFIDAEYKVVDVVDGEGKFRGKAMFECVMDSGKEFTATPQGTFAVKEAMFKNKKKYIGKYVTVRYFSTTKEGKPFHGVAIGTREEGEF